MKFGKSLPRNQVPGWGAFYINYKGLKKLIKAEAQNAQKGQKANLTVILSELDRNLETVDGFYNSKLSEGNRRLGLLNKRYGNVAEIVSSLGDDEIEVLIGALLELRHLYRNLQWFGEINRKGFVKITKKLDKKLLVPHKGALDLDHNMLEDLSKAADENADESPLSSTLQYKYITTKVDRKPFAWDEGTTRTLSEINKWLSLLGDAQNADDSKSEKSVRSLGRSLAKGTFCLPQPHLDELDQAARSDDVATLESDLDGITGLGELSLQPLFLALLQRAISSRSRKCVQSLLGRMTSIEEPEDINGRNCIHRLVIHIGRTKSTGTIDQGANGYPFNNITQFSSHYLQPAASAATTPLPLNENETGLLTEDNEAVQMLVFLLDKLSPDQRSALGSRDINGRTPLHYAAQFGFVVVCELLISRMKSWGQITASDDLESQGWQDEDGHSPLHLSVMGGHPKTTQALVNVLRQERPPDPSVQEPPTLKSGVLLSLATKANFSVIAQILVDAKIDINWQDRFGETALHVAARLGHTECARVLVNGNAVQKADTSITESTYGWTPLHIASVEGHLDIVRLLVDSGADVAKPDSSGWLAKEHAALRGHVDIARCLNARMKELCITEVSESKSPSPRSTTPSIQSRISNGITSPSPSLSDPELVKSFGHRYLGDQTMVLVTLGSMDIRSSIEAVTFEKVPLTEAHLTGLDTALSIVIYAKGAQGDPVRLDLPVQENVSTEPVAFTTSDPSKVTIYFDIVPTYSSDEANKIGRAFAPIPSLQQRLGPKRMSLHGDQSLPIVSHNLEVIGMVNFSFQMITPFSHPNMELVPTQMYWKKLADTMVIGHRGLGKNLSSTRSLQLGENTVPSFIAAANLGAQYVEFDVQLTKDHVPVIYHDFLVSETGIDAPVHTLTLEQFLHINPDSSHKLSRESQQAELSGRVRRSNSLDSRKSSKALADTMRDRTHMEERMKHTRDFKEKGYKGNSRGNVIQAPFATLEDLFRQIPESVGFNIEMKYPMLHESEEQEMDSYAVELNSFCDTVLAKVYDLAANRNIIFSSFNPDICLCLSVKQPSIPILFLTDAGTCPVADIRASSLQEAIRFASRWDLLGIVSAAEPLVNSPRLVRVIKERGLVCVSYGTLNNDPAMVQKQVKEGIDAVIVDSVLAIRKGLTSNESQAEAEQEAPVSLKELSINA